jgi:hypothetical protein
MSQCSRGFEAFTNTFSLSLSLSHIHTLHIYYNILYIIKNACSLTFTWVFLKIICTEIMILLICQSHEYIFPLTRDNKIIDILYISILSIRRLPKVPLLRQDFRLVFALCMKRFITNETLVSIGRFCTVQPVMVAY